MRLQQPDNGYELAVAFSTGQITIINIVAFEVLQIVSRMRTEVA